MVAVDHRFALPFGTSLRDALSGNGQQTARGSLEPMAITARSRARLPKNRSQASALRASRAAPSRPPPARTPSPPPFSKISLAPSKSCARHVVTWLGCTSYCCARSASVRSPFTASSATRALNAALWFRLGRLVMLPPRPRHHADLTQSIHSSGPCR
jgi:hypothetical protein